MCHELLSGWMLDYQYAKTCVYDTFFFFVVCTLHLQFLWPHRLVDFQLGLKRLSIFAYRLTVNTNDRFIGLTSIDYLDLGHWAILVAFATIKKKKLNSKQRLSTIVISCHSWTSQQPVWWSVAGWFSIRLPHYEACYVGCFIAGYMVSFGNVSRRPVDNSNLFATPRGTAAKFSVVHLPLKRRVSRTPLHSAAATILNPESERRASKRSGRTCTTLTHRQSGERHTTSCLRSRETLHFLLATLLSVGKERGELRAGRNLVLRF